MMENTHSLSRKTALVMGGNRFSVWLSSGHLPKQRADIARHLHRRESEAYQFGSLVERVGRRYVAVNADIPVIADESEAHRRKDWGGHYSCQLLGHPTSPPEYLIFIILILRFFSG